MPPHPNVPSLSLPSQPITERQGENWHKFPQIWAIIVMDTLRDIVISYFWKILVRKKLEI